MLQCISLILQLALPTTQPSSLKRSVPQEFDDHDSENVDPSIFLSSNKKSKNIDLDFAKPNKASHFILTNTPFVPSVVNRPIITPGKLQKRKAEVPSAPNIPDRLQKSRRAGASAPTAIGRSPKSKRIGILSRRRVSSSPFTRIDPPSCPKEGSRTGVPLSLDAALSGTISSYKPVQPVEVPTLEESIPKSWIFDIHEDTKQGENLNLMNHGACTLDISSDDESRAAAKDDRGKENIPPTNGLAYSSATVTSMRADIMTDEPRIPLVALDETEFYAQGSDASSNIVVPAENEIGELNKKVAIASQSMAACTPTQPWPNAKLETAPGWDDFLEQMEQSKKDMKDMNEYLASTQETSSHQPEIEIWESESAKGDHDITVQDLSRSTTPIHSVQPECNALEIVDDACLVQLA